MLKEITNSINMRIKEAKERTGGKNRNEETALFYSYVHCFCIYIYILLIVVLMK